MALRSDYATLVLVNESCGSSPNGSEAETEHQTNAFATKIGACDGGYISLLLRTRQRWEFSPHKVGDWNRTVTHPTLGFISERASFVVTHQRTL